MQDLGFNINKEIKIFFILWHYIRNANYLQRFQSHEDSGLSPETHSDHVHSRKLFRDLLQPAA